jgi:hypothetical protein
MVDFAPTRRGSVAASVTIAPITEGKTDEWRAFVADLQASRRIEWAQSQRRRGITRQVITISEGDRSLAIVYTEAGDVEAATVGLASSDDPFDVWYRRRVADLHDEALETEVVFDSAPRPGPWRGWR